MNILDQQIDQDHDNLEIQCPSSFQDECDLRDPQSKNFIQNKHAFVPTNNSNETMGNFLPSENYTKNGCSFIPQSVQVFNQVPTITQLSLSKMIPGSYPRFGCERLCDFCGILKPINQIFESIICGMFTCTEEHCLRLSLVTHEVRIVLETSEELVIIHSKRVWEKWALSLIK